MFLENSIFKIVLFCYLSVLLCSVLTGSPVNLFAAHGPEPWWSSCPWDCSHVQDWQGQVWVHCTLLDAEVCHGLEVWLQAGQTGECADPKNRYHLNNQSSHSVPASMNGLLRAIVSCWTHMYYLVKSVVSGSLFYLTIPLSDVASLIIIFLYGSWCLLLFL